MRVVVVGGTGLVGSKVVAKLNENGHDVMPASPRTGVNTVTGEGLGAAFQGVDVVVDVTNPPSREAEAITTFFVTSTRNQLEAEEAAGVAHHVVLSVVGTDRLDESAYFRAKRGQEELVEASPVPFSIIRATQFFEFIGVITDVASKNGEVRLPPVLIQPIAADDVASVVAATAVRPPLNGTVELGGPERFRLDELVRGRLSALGDPRRVLTDPGAGYFGTPLEERTLVPDDDAILGVTRLEDWVADPIEWVTVYYIWPCSTGPAGSYVASTTPMSVVVRS